MLVSAENLAVRYRNGALGIADVSFGVAPGTIVALFGANGAGKTTSLRAVSGFLRTEGARIIHGRVVFDQQDITQWEPHDVANLGCATVLERRKVFPNLTVLDNLLALGPRLGRDRPARLERVFAMFPILRDKRKDQAGRLSGGQQQMLALSRALMSQPRFLMIDEVTLGLHPSLHGPLYRTIRQIADGGTAVLLVDENAAAALDVADHCYVLRAGRVQDEGGPEKFRGAELIAAGYVGDE